MTILRNLGNGLVLRSVTPRDTNALADFQVQNMHFPMGFHIQEWLREGHPTSDINGFTVVEETQTGAMVSAAALLPQTFTYGGVPFTAGRAEAVATRPDYRRRGLVRAQFDVLHKWADAQGQLLQIVEGATWLYRDFGYEPALDNFGGMNSGGRIVYRHALPRLKDGETEPFALRRAVEADLPFVGELFAQSRKRYVLAAEETPAVWEFLLRGGQPDYNRWFDLRVITKNDERVGFVVHDPWGCGRVLLYEVQNNVSWLAVTPSVLRTLFVENDRIARENGRTFDGGIAFCLAPGHPVFTVAPDLLTPNYDAQKAWGIRVPDVPAFVRHIAPALDARIANSPLAGHTGDLRLNFYRTGLHLSLVDGRVTRADAWTPAYEGEGDAGFTGRLFLPLLFGHRTMDELRHWDNDCWVGSNDTKVLLPTLFPKMASHVMALA